MRKGTVERRAQIPIRNLGVEKWPVNIEEIADKLNADVAKADLPDETSGVLEKVHDGRSMIIVNKSHAPVRQRFTIAHELGHLVFSDRSGLYVDKEIFFRNGRSQDAVDEAEIVANTFAAELLMPTPFIKKALNKFIRNGRIDVAEDVIGKMALEFDVSSIAMSIKLQNLGLSF
ncbi:MAG: ImmA/IrrE family metallo-endopeptidase [Chitinivibrionales bacterium]|nr:ImmA/IrrE family metallo-endopeptidase [Chitinivibrionales bacterium]